MRSRPIRTILSRIATVAATLASGAAGASAAVYVLDGHAGGGVSGLEPRLAAADHTALPEIESRPAARPPRRGPSSDVVEVAESPRFVVSSPPAGGAGVDAAPGIQALGGLPQVDGNAEVGTPPAIERRAGPAPQGPRAGTLSKRRVRRVVRAGMPAIRRCYERSLRRQGFGDEHDLGLQVRVSPSGSVRSVHVSGAAAGGLGRCIGSSVAAWRFPRTREGAILSVPVRLRPRDE